MSEGQEGNPPAETPTADAADQFLRKRLVGRDTSAPDDRSHLTEEETKEIGVKIVQDEKDIVRLTTLFRKGETYGRESEFQSPEELSDIIVHSMERKIL